MSLNKSKDNYWMSLNKSKDNYWKQQVRIKSIFKYDQLFIALRRVRSRGQLKVLIHDNDREKSNETTYIVFKKVFHYNLQEGIYA